MNNWEQTVYLDKLCIKSIVLLLKSGEVKRVVYFQERRPFLLSNLLSRFLTFVGVDVVYSPVENSDRRYRDVFDTVDDFLSTCNVESAPKSNRYLHLFADRIISKYRFDKVWRLFVNIEYLQSICGDNPARGYFGVGLSKPILYDLSKYVDGKYERLNVDVYKSYAIVNEPDVLYKNVDGVKVRLLNAIKLVYLLLAPPKLSSSDHFVLDTVFFSHDPGTYNDMFYPSRLMEGVKGRHAIITPMRKLVSLETMLEMGEVSISVRNLPAYYLNFYKNLMQIIGQSRDLGELYKLTQIIYAYSLMKVFVNERNVSIVFSFYESWFAQAASVMARDSDNVVSLSAVWSIGYFPSSSISTFKKFSDRYFIWGSWHNFIMRKSYDQSGGYIVTGYPGLVIDKTFERSVSTLRDQLLKAHKRVIAYYDTTTADDLFFSKVSSIKVLKSLLQIAQETDSVLIFKTKKKVSDETKKLIDCYASNILVDNTQSSLIPAFAADVTFGILNSTLVSIAAAYGKRAYFIAFGDVVSPVWKSLVGERVEFIEANDIKRSLLDCPDQSNTNDDSGLAAIDYFQDGNCHDRTGDYINNVLKNLHVEANKQDALSVCDQIYRNKFGEDTVI